MKTFGERKCQCQRLINYHWLIITYKECFLTNAKVGETAAEWYSISVKTPFSTQGMSQKMPITMMKLTSSSEKCALNDFISHLRSYKSGLEQKKVWRQKTSQLTQNTQVVHREPFDMVGAQWTKGHHSVSDYMDNPQREVQLNFYF